MAEIIVIDDANEEMVENCGISWRLLKGAIKGLNGAALRKTMAIDEKWRKNSWG